jgi:hypothetical protein
MFNIFYDYDAGKKGINEQITKEWKANEKGDD